MQLVGQCGKTNIFFFLETTTQIENKAAVVNPETLVDKEPPVYTNTVDFNSNKQDVIEVQIFQL